MDWIVRWLLGKANEMFGDVYTFLGTITQDIFSNDVVNSLFIFFGSLGLGLVGLAMICLLFKNLLQQADGNQFSIADILKRLIGGAVIYAYGVDIMKNLYYVVLSVTGKLISAISGLSADSISIDFKLTGALSIIMTLILTVIALFCMMKTFFQLLERAWQYLVTLVLMYLYLYGYIMGNDESMIMWFKQCLAIMLTQFFQVLLVTIGMCLFVNAAEFSTFCFAIGAITTSSKVQEVLDKFGMSVGGTLANTAKSGMSMAFYTRSILSRK